MTKTARVLVSAILALLLAGPGCGNGDGGSTGDGSESTGEGSTSGSGVDTTLDDDGSADDGEGNTSALDETYEAEARWSVCSGDPVFLPFVKTLGLIATGQLSPNHPLVVDTECMLTATSCHGVLACSGIDTTDECDPAAFGSTCLGGTKPEECVATADGLGWIRSSDCATDPSGNTTCESGSFGPACTTGPCDDPYDTCSGTTNSWCFSYSEFGGAHDCALNGEVCAEWEGSAACVASKESCTEDVCKGDRLVRCWGGVTDWDIDCKALDPRLTCISSSDDFGCFAPAEEQVCELGETRCVGSTAQVCLTGVWFDVDCSNFLDGYCVTHDWGVGCRSDAWPHVFATNGPDDPDDPDDPGCEASCTEYYEAYNVCTEESGGTAWSDDDIASFCDISLACDYYDYGAYFACLLTNIPTDCGTGTWGTEICTLQ